MAIVFHSSMLRFHTIFFLVLLLVGFCRQLVAVPKDHPWQKVSRPEKLWSAVHPFKAGKVYRCGQRARIVTDSLQRAGVISDADGGQLDAFRHAYWMALMITEGLSARTARKVGEKHEKGNYLGFRKGEIEDSVRADSMATVMDLRNNEKGIETGKEFMAGNKNVSLIQLLINRIWNGELFILKKDAARNYLDCENKLITVSSYAGKWYIPKCLVKSNEIAVKH
jgi:hypothetical protein